MPTAEEMLAWARDRLANTPGVEPLDASILLTHVMSITRETLLTHPRRLLEPDQEAEFRALIERRATGEPVAYLLGRHPFYHSMLRVTPDVLIPRPETEHLVETALAWLKGRQWGALRIADVGTGSGAILTALGSYTRNEARYWAIDISVAALEVARINAQRFNVTFIRGDLLQPLIDLGLRMDLIAANLPYIPSAELGTLAVAKHEPRLALDGGADGLDAIRRLLGQAPRVMADDSLLVLEIGAGQGAAVAELALAALPGAQVSVIQDYSGQDRVARIEHSRIYL